METIIRKLAWSTICFAIAWLIFIPLQETTGMTVLCWGLALSFCAVGLVFFDLVAVQIVSKVWVSGIVGKLACLLLLCAAILGPSAAMTLWLGNDAVAMAYTGVVFVFSLILVLTFIESCSKANTYQQPR